MSESHIATLDDGTQVTVINGTLHIFIPANFKKKVGRKRIVSPLNPEPQGPLVTQIVRAFKWQKMLDEGEYSSVSDLARALGLDQSYVATSIRFTLLAPDIIQAILSGNEPSGMSVTKLRKILSLLDWEKQQQEFYK